MYATAEYYKNEYHGLELSTDVLDRLILRANKDVERLTRSRIDMDSLSELNQKRVMNAVCSQVEFLASKGETASTIADNTGSFSIGSYSESKGGRYGAAADANTSRYADAVYDWLFPTGLLYAGVDALW